ncbi:hypothetical protein [Tropicimonas marinistellae]|uniref:hypothetical protein n=1 Tax=Tropicimonas marinistellae TaxID=1739787 RepID=UPI00191A2682|nr:hypothetical protein [Tropicimonas marinistellae]
MTDACKACAFFETTEAKAADAGLCHFNPPAPTSDKESRWPAVSADDWCARFEAQAK